MRISTSGPVVISQVTAECDQSMSGSNAVSASRAPAVTFFQSASQARYHHTDQASKGSQSERFFSIQSTFHLKREIKSEIFEPEPRQGEETEVSGEG